MRCWPRPTGTCAGPAIPTSSRSPPRPATRNTPWSSPMTAPPAPPAGRCRPRPACRATRWSSPPGVAGPTSRPPPTARSRPSWAASPAGSSASPAAGRPGRREHLGPAARRWGRVRPVHWPLRAQTGTASDGLVTIPQSFLQPYRAQVPGPSSARPGSAASRSRCWTSSSRAGGGCSPHRDPGRDGVPPHLRGPGEQPPEDRPARPGDHAPGWVVAVRPGRRVARPPLDVQRPAFVGGPLRLWWWVL